MTTFFLSECMFLCGLEAWFLQKTVLKHLILCNKPATLHFMASFFSSVAFPRAVIELNWNFHVSLKPCHYCLQLSFMTVCKPHVALGISQLSDVFVAHRQVALEDVQVCTLTSPCMCLCRATLLAIIERSWLRLSLGTRHRRVLPLPSRDCAYDISTTPRGNFLSFSTVFSLSTLLAFSIGVGTLAYITLSVVKLCFLCCILLL